MVALLWTWTMALHKQRRCVYCGLSSGLGINAGMTPRSAQAELVSLQVAHTTHIVPFNSHVLQRVACSGG